MLIDPFQLTGLVAIVTGGAGGIGGAIAREFAERGARVLVADLPAKRERPVTPCGCLDMTFTALDVTDEAAVDAIFDKAAADFGRIDILVNSAGIASRAAAVEHTRETWDNVFAVNVTGTFLCSRSAARHMITASSGTIINIASIMGLSGGGLYPNISYQASKGAVINMTRALALEWARSGVRVNAIAPTYVRTDFIKALLDDPPLRARIEALTPLGRIAEPSDIAAAAVYLASPAAAMVTGHILAVDGGFLAQ
ncbi:MAG: glucose 1-dehydrogenase [Casimicrobiaceae bacterium]